MSTNVDSSRSAVVSTQRENEVLTAIRLLDRAGQILDDVHQSEFMTKNAPPREYPRFDRNEISFGRLLGVGGYGIVFEVKNIALKAKVPEEIKILHQKEEMPTDAADIQTESIVSKDTADPPEKVPSDESHTSAMSDADLSDSKDRASLHLQTESQSEITAARDYMNQHVRRENGDARYAIKRLHKSLNEVERARGMIDLAIEAKFLSTIWHPNIVKMRGMASGSILSKDFFIVMDRLYGTLKEKMGEWARAQNASRGFLGLRRNQLRLDQLLLERMMVAFDLASAFWYLHDNRIVYRDIKPENIGFDYKGDPIIIDLGLCKSLSQNLKNKKGIGYLLTPRTGSVPYMAPEVVLSQPYSCSCDVFSFAVLAWEILSLRAAFKACSRREYLHRVVKGRERMPISRRLPPLTRLMIKEGWNHDPVQRPSMKRVSVLLQGDLNELKSDSNSRSAALS